MLRLLHSDCVEPVCRLCGCTEGARCSPEGCAMVYDPAGGDLCGGCLDRVFAALGSTLEGLARVMGGASKLAAINDDAAILIQFAALEEGGPPPAIPVTA